MKKTILLAFPILLVLIVMAFTTKVNPVENPANAHVIIHVTGCTDCNKFTYCLDGGGIVYAGTCDLDFWVDPGDHIICLICGGGTSGSQYSFSVKDDTYNVFNVNMLSLPTACDCDGAKRKKK